MTIPITQNKSQPALYDAVVPNIVTNMNTGEQIDIGKAMTFNPKDIARQNANYQTQIDSIQAKIDQNNAILKAYQDNIQLTPQPLPLPPSPAPLT